MTRPPEMRAFDRVLVGVDGHEGGRAAIALARQLVPAPERLVLGHIYRGLLGLVGGLSGDDERTRATDLMVREREESMCRPAAIVVQRGTPAAGLKDLAEHEGATLLVLGSSHRSPIGRVLIGDDTVAVLNGARWSVAIAPRGYRARGRRLQTIGVGHDGSAESELALQAARLLARRHHAVVRLLSVVPLQSVSDQQATPLDWTEETQRVVDQEHDRIAAINDVEGEVRYGDPAEELASFGNQVDLLVVGSRGFGSLGRLLNGSTATYLARHATCPLLVLPGPLLASGPVAPAEPSPRPFAREGRAS
jgi:nucleotide-binding universal stress UspA family protein